jgi:hypothetical protein
LAGARKPLLKHADAVDVRGAEMRQQRRTSA